MDNPESCWKQPLEANNHYVYVDGIYLKRNWEGKVENISILVALAVNKDAYREIIGAADGAKDDKMSLNNFLRVLKELGLKATCLAFNFIPFMN